MALAWGPDFWRFIHLFAKNDVGRDLFTLLKVPCAKCQADYTPPTDDEPLFQWSLDAHNRVNKQIGRDEWTIEQLDASVTPCDHTCHMDLFPWKFIRTFARTQTRDVAIEFLLKFQAQYPCSTCTFFDDEPSPDETVLAWVDRNYVKRKLSVTSNVV